MLYPVLPVFLTQTLRASGTIVGLVDGFAQATQNIVQGFSGALSDKLQRRKPVAFAGYAPGRHRQAADGAGDDLAGRSSVRGCSTGSAPAHVRHRAMR